MSKIDELIPIAERLRKVQDDLTQWIQKYEPSGLKTETPEPKPTGKWISANGPKGPFELLKDKDTVEYRELKNDLDYADHPLSKKFADGKVYSFWLMQDNETIARRLKA